MQIHYIWNCDLTKIVWAPLFFIFLNQEEADKTAESFPLIYHWVDVAVRFWSASKVVIVSLSGAMTVDSVTYGVAIPKCYWERSPR